MEAFWTLSTERPISGMAIGPIPRSKVREYAREELGLEEDALNVFWTVISAMDAGYLGWQGSEFKRYQRNAAAAAPKSASKGASPVQPKAYGR